MKHASLLLLFLTSFSLARADGFKCEAQNTGLLINLFNHTEVSEGTRTPAVMIISDPALRPLDQTLAKFSSEHRDLEFLGHGKYSAKVDLRFKDSGRKSAILAGAKLAELSTIQLIVNFSYDHDSTDLARITSVIPGKIYYQKRSGGTVDEIVFCTRYLKNQTR